MGEHKYINKYIIGRTQRILTSVKPFWVHVIMYLYKPTEPEHKLGSLDDDDDVGC